MTSSNPPLINRELSWLEFNQRVLEEAQDESLPLLERLKFLSITGSNLDEFYRVRVGGLELLAERGSATVDPAGMTPLEQVQAIGTRARRMVKDQYAVFVGLEEQLATHGIRRLSVRDLNERQRGIVRQIFDDEIYPVFTPQVAQSTEDFPLVPSGALNIAVRIRSSTPPKGTRIAVIPLGRAATRWFTIPAERGYSYVLVEEILREHVGQFFSGEEVLECVPFRILRNADLSVREDWAPDLLVGMQEVLEARRHGGCVRLDVASDLSKEMLEFLREMLVVSEANVFRIPGPLDLAALMPLSELNGFESLRYEPWPPQPCLEFDPKQSIFEVLATRDVLLRHPYESFEPVVRFIEEAAADPDVLAIKQILYRTSRNSPIVAALARAAQRGKNVTAIVELKARFDEARNMEWARNLERADVQVIYGVKGLKTHAKVCIVVRREPQGIQRYVHFGTGNYNEVTARVYSDVSLMTSNEELGAEAISFFNAISGLSQPQGFQKLQVAPIGLREKVLELILGEKQRAEQGQRAEIVAKLNALVDPEMIEALYAASQAGVRIRLNIRGICCLRPGVAGKSDQVQVVSIVDRFLEHARILYFYHGGDERTFISSADWMPRNLDRRVELLVPIEDRECKQRLIEILEAYFLDREKARQLSSDGSYRRLRDPGRKGETRSQELLYHRICQEVKRASRSTPTVFEPHRAPGSD